MDIIKDRHETLPSCGCGLVYKKELSMNLVRYAPNDSTLLALSRRCSPIPISFKLPSQHIDVFLADRPRRLRVSILPSISGA
jgi:hypothetical protein